MCGWVYEDVCGCEDGCVSMWMVCGCEDGFVDVKMCVCVCVCVCEDKGVVAWVSVSVQL